MAAERAIEWVFGDVLEMDVSWLPAGAPANLTGWSADMKIRNEAGDELLWLSTAGASPAITIPAPLTGKVVLRATAAHMLAGSIENVDATHRYDLQVKGPSGPHTLLRGPFVVRYEVTDV